MPKDILKPASILLVKEQGSYSVGGISMIWANKFLLLKLLRVGFTITESQKSWTMSCLSHMLGCHRYLG